MNRNKKIRRKFAQCTAAGMAMMLGTTSIYAQAAETAEVSKDETVFIIADSSGNKKETTVSNWLKNAGARTDLKDQSDLTEIENLKGNETFTESGSQIIWKTDGEDIYYTGKSQKNAPVSVAFTYYLNGKEISPEQLKGKSGKLKIQIDYQNNAKQTVKIRGKKETIYSPFLMMTGMVLPNENFDNVVIDNGKVISDGNKNIVIGCAMPGLKESLGLDKTEETDLDLPESLAVTADVTDFSMGATYTFASADIFQDMDTENIDSVDELEDALDELEDASLELADGSKELANGTKELSENYQTFDEGIQTLKNGIDTLQSGSGELSEGIWSYTAGADQLNDGIQKYLGSEGVLTGSVKEYKNGVNTLVLGIQEYAEGTVSLSDGVKQYIAGEQQLAKGAESLEPLSDGLNQTKSAITQLYHVLDGEGSSQEDIVTAVEELSQGMEQLNQAMESEDAQKFLTYMEALEQSGTALKNGAGSLEETIDSQVASQLQGIVSVGTELQTQAEALNQQLSTLQEKEQENVNSALEQAAAEVNSQIQSANASLQEQASNAAADAQSQANEQIYAARNSLYSQADAAEAEGNADAANALRNAAASLSDVSVAPADAGGISEISVPSVTVDSVSVSIEDLQSSLSQLDSACETLFGGMETAQAKAGELQKQMDEMKGQAENLEQLAAMQGSLKENIGQLNTGVQGLNTAVGQLSENLSALDQGTEAFPQAAQGIDDLLSGFHTLGMNNRQLLTGAKQLKQNAPGIVRGAATLQSGTEELSDGLADLSGQLSSGAGQLAANSSALRKGAGDLDSGIQALSSGAVSLQEGSSQVSSGISQLDDGAVTLRDGMKKFQDEGIHELTAMADEKLGDLWDRLDVLTSPKYSYQTFSGKADDMDGNVKFIIVTEEIKDRKE